MSLPAEARKCPHCHTYQTRLAQCASWAPPAVAIAFMAVMLGGYALIFRDMFDQGEPFAKHEDHIEVVASRVEFGNADDRPTVAVIGRVRNGSSVDWKDFVFHVEFHDAAGKLTDAGQELNYYESLPAGEELAFKLSLPREFAESAYAKHTIRIVSARDAVARF
jgi:hypothetical protein